MVASRIAGRQHDEEAGAELAGRQHPDVDHRMTLSDLPRDQQHERQHAGRCNLHDER